MPKSLRQSLYGHLQITIGPELQNKPVFLRSTWYHCFVASKLVFQSDMNSLDQNNVFEGSVGKTSNSRAVRWLDLLQD